MEEENWVVMINPTPIRNVRVTSLLSTKINSMHAISITME